MSTTISAHIPSAEGSKTKEVVLLIILAAVQFSYLMDYVLLIPLGPQLMKVLKINSISFCYLISSYTFSASVVGFISSFYIDRLDRKKALLFVYFGFSVGPLLCAISSDFYLLLLARIFTGAFGGILSSLLVTTLRDAIPVARLGEATSYIVAANGAATIIGVPSGLYFAYEVGWKGPFYVLGFLAIALLAAIYFVLPSMKTHLERGSTAKESKKTIEIINNPRFLWPILFMGLLTFAGGFTIFPFLSTYLVSNVAFTGLDISFLFFLGGLASFVAGPIAGSLTDHFGKQNVFLLISFLSIVPVLLVTMYPLDSKLFSYVASTLFFMFSTARFVSGMALMNSKFSREERGKFLGINSSVQLMAGTIGTIISGYTLYTEEGRLMNFDILGVIAICATLLCVFMTFMWKNN